MELRNNSEGNDYVRATTATFCVIIAIAHMYLDERDIYRSHAQWKYYRSMFNV